MSPLLAVVLRPFSRVGGIPILTRSTATKPPSDLLDREWSRDNVRDVNDFAVPMLQEIVNHGVAALSRCVPGLSEDHLLEMVDAVEVLVAAAASGPAQLQLRSAFESLLAIEYILEAHTENRAYHWLAANAQEEILKVWKVRWKYPELDPTPKRTDEHLGTLQRRLQRPGWREANERLLETARQRMEAAERRTGKTPLFRVVEWFSVEGGPSNRADLAARLGRAKDYDVLYRQWSGVVHGNDFEEHLIRIRGADKPVIRRLRLPADLRNVVSLAVTFTYDATKSVLGFYRPGEETGLRNWYEREIRGPLHRL
jgi:hypothetical protein